MIRVVLSCLLVVAIAGVVFPAADAARTESTATHVETTADEIAQAAHDLVADEDPAPAGLAGPTRRISVTVPTESWRRVEVSSLTVRGGTHLELVAQTATGATTARRIDVPRIRPTDGTLELEPGTHTLSLTLRGNSTASVVVVEAA